MSISETMTNIYGLFDRNCHKYMSSIDLCPEIKPDPKARERRVLSHDDIVKIFQLRKQGLSSAKIGTIVNCCESSVRRIIIKYKDPNHRTKQ